MENKLNLNYSGGFFFWLYMYVGMIGKTRHNHLKWFWRTEKWINWYNYLINYHSFKSFFLII